MALLTSGIFPRPYGKGGRKVVLPVKATTQIYQGMLLALIAGAVVPATTAGAGDAIGVAESDMLGGATDGAKRISVLTDQEFVFPAGVAAPTDATPFGSLIFAEDDHTAGTGGLGSQVILGKFTGIEDDGSVRVYVGILNTEWGSQTQQVVGTPIGNVAAITVQRVGRVSRYVLGVLSQAITITLGTTGAVKGDVMRIVRTDATSAFTAAVVNGGAGAGTLATLLASKSGFCEAYFDGTNWLFDGAAPT